MSISLTNELSKDLAPRYIPTKRDHDPRSACESGNRLSSSISSLSTNLMSYISHERTQPRSYLRVDPYQVGSQSKNCTHKSCNELSRSKSLIISLSAQLMSYVPHEQTWPRSCPNVHPYEIGPCSEKNCACETMTGLAGQIHWLTNYVFNELILSWTKSVVIISQGTSLQTSL